MLTAIKSLLQPPTVYKGIVSFFLKKGGNSSNHTQTYLWSRSLLFNTARPSSSPSYPEGCSTTPQVSTRLLTSTAMSKHSWRTAKSAQVTRRQSVPGTVKVTERMTRESQFVLNGVRSVKEKSVLKRQS